MLQISRESHLCTVIVTVDAKPAVMSDLESHAAVGLERFREFSGFIAGALHKSVDGTRLVQYLQWRTEAEYRACINAGAWDELPSTQRFMELINSGQARVDVRTFDVVALAEGQS